MLDQSTAKRVMLARVREWDTEVSGECFFDVKGATYRQNPFAVTELLRASPEAGLDHG